jgi:hypothetical protein
LRSVRSRVPDGRAAAEAARYERNVFINCPFDEGYEPVFRAIVFTIFECGLTARCAKEAYDSGEVRIEKIIKIIRECCLGIHDVSRTDTNERGLPRFNMPLELGLFLGARRFGSGRQRRKSCLVLDREQYRYQEFISDIAGQDIAAHGNEPRRAIRAVRDWLATVRTGPPHPPGAADIEGRHGTFERELPTLCAATRRRSEELTFVEYADIVSTWLRREIAAAHLMVLGVPTG